MSENENEKRDTVADIVTEIRDALRNENPWGENDTRTAWINSGSILAYLDRIEAAWKREREEIVDAVSVLRDGMCPHCDMQQQCAEGDDGMSTTCNAMAIVNNFINRYKEPEVSDECPF